MKKIILLLSMMTIILALTGCGKSNSNGNSEDLTINIGIQQDVGPLLLAKQQGLFEKAFKKDGVKVKWTEFQSGPPQIEAMSANHLDFAGVGNAPVITAQAAGVDFKEIANTKQGLKGDAILVPKNSAIKTLNDLKGKKIAVAKGSSGYYLLYKALQKAGLKDSDVQIIQLQPDEAQSAFNSKKVDAWSIWEPFISYQTIKNKSRVLTDEEHLGTYAPSFLLARTQFTKDHPDLTVKFLKVFEEALKWEKDHFDEAVSIYSQAKHLDKEVVKTAIINNPTITKPISSSINQAQQKTADFSYDQKIINKKIKTSEVVDNQFIEKALKTKE
ncbi:aliphatic sulfonate ABC transporter substrate-binding protein [Terrilactibacillus sp. BCM23-1]|uniref:Putative aliphatic sulfonates-binding protein n=1 Tax=Terrilactibacillus tamarindi TaxID=2599694 RepID=A0A6N8CTI7_9BACI|nr:aliphatic sulfonate ABC transporter substrate-binding protein [Terrilactibacillus tamarindi]MTT32353.1 aliphatic sulfonate ABC transporter substrate-binding protein [Terrilactibacillus tamarindi]